MANSLTPLARKYFHHYTQQEGSGYPVFRGGIGYQSGGSLGDTLRSAARIFLPIAGNAAQKFGEAMSAALAEGKSVEASARKALVPTLSQAADDLSDKFLGTKNEQEGSGRRGWRRRRKGKALQAGMGRRRRRLLRANKSKHNRYRKPVYKAMRNRSDGIMNLIRKKEHPFGLTNF